MKKFLLIVVAACFATSMYAVENDVVILSTETYDSVKTVDTQTYYFQNTSVTLSMHGRAFTKLTRQDCATALNFKNNTQYTINLGDVKAYRIEFAGFSQGDNWSYLYAWGVGDKDGAYEWVDSIGKSVTDNIRIINHGTYPLDPCVVNPDKANKEGSPVLHVAGYTFAALDFTNEAYEGTFNFFFSGNNQERALIRIYTTKDAADKAAAGINDVKTTVNAGNNALYNLSGQRVDSSYKGVVVKNNKKYIVK